MDIQTMFVYTTIWTIPERSVLFRTAWYADYGYTRYIDYSGIDINIYS